MILRTYRCPECWHEMTVELRADQWDQEPPDCPACLERSTEQVFKPPTITGSPGARAKEMALDIAVKDYGLADIQSDHHEGAKPRVRYKEANPNTSTWGAQPAALQQAIALGRENRLRYGSGLDALQSALKTGDQPDLIELSKKRSARIW